MYHIDMTPMTPEFFELWRAAGLHLEKQVDGGIQGWLRAHPNPPFLEHLSFRLGNQLFFVLVEDDDDRILGPGHHSGLQQVAGLAQGHACILPMRRTPNADGWQPTLPGWGLFEIPSCDHLDPVSLVTDELIDMTPWERHDMAVQVVRETLQAEGYELMSWHANPGIDPAIWFVGQSGGPEWVVVRGATLDEPEPQRPANWDQIAAGCARDSRIGHFAPVFLGSSRLDGRLVRGHALDVEFRGLANGGLTS